MSLDSTLLIDTDASPVLVQELLSRTGVFQMAGELGGAKLLRAEGVLIHVYVPPMGDVELQQAEIDAALEMFFDNTDNRLTYEWTLNPVRAVMALLHAYPGDALFMYCSDSPALLRKGGRIILDRRAGLWDEGVEPNVLALVNLPYTFGTIPVT
jgi:hypothetical protein